MRDTVHKIVHSGGGFPNLACVLSQYGSPVIDLPKVVDLPTHLGLLNGLPQKGRPELGDSTPGDPWPCPAEPELPRPTCGGGLL